MSAAAVPRLWRQMRGAMLRGAPLRSLDFGGRPLTWPGRPATRPVPASPRQAPACEQYPRHVTGMNIAEPCTRPKPSQRHRRSAWRRLRRTDPRAAHRTTATCRATTRRATPAVLVLALAAGRARFRTTASWLACLKQRPRIWSREAAARCCLACQSRPGRLPARVRWYRSCQRRQCAVALVLPTPLRLRRCRRRCRSACRAASSAPCDLLLCCDETLDAPRWTQLTRPRRAALPNAVATTTNPTFPRCLAGCAHDGSAATACDAQATRTATDNRWHCTRRALEARSTASGSEARARLRARGGVGRFGESWE
mmetsp:Transcript_7202/g.25733  ORF Transcript_7202/g.25733 Transcript_7202/m.25733 type:complete len:312 (-) Transcript_7202:22-957(-)